MKTFGKFIFCTLLFASLPVKAEKLYYYDTLENGMQVVVIPNHKVPAVTHMVWYKTGAVYEKPGKSGVAHYLEHLMFKGTGLIKAGEFSSTIAKNGGHDNAFTSYDFTSYFQVVPSASLEKVMQLESDRMVNLNVPENEAENEKQVVLEERRSTLENEPASLLAEKIKAELFRGNHYAIPIIGSKEDVTGLKLADVMDFYHTYYNPANAILVVAGDVDPDDVFALAEKYYGPIEAKKIEKAQVPEAGKVLKKNIVLKDEKVKQKQLFVYFRTPTVTSAKNNELVYPLTLLSEILGGSTSSRLYQSMVAKQKIATSVSAYYDEAALSDSNFIIEATPAKRKSLGALENAISYQLKKIAQNGVSDAELRRAKNSLVAEIIYSRDSLKGLAFAYGQALSINLPVTYIEEWPGEIEAVDSGQIRQAAQFLLDDENKVTGHLLPK